VVAGDQGDAEPGSQRLKGRRLIGGTNSFAYETG